MSIIRPAFSIYHVHLSFSRLFLSILTRNPAHSIKSRPIFILQRYQYPANYIPLHHHRLDRFPRSFETPLSFWEYPNRKTNPTNHFHHHKRSDRDTPPTLGPQTVRLDRTPTKKRIRRRSTTTTRRGIQKQGCNPRWKEARININYS